MAFKTSDIDIMYVRNGLDHDSLDLGTLCLSNKINPWSTYKPMNFGSASYANRVLAIPGISGFKISGQQLVYDKPTSGYGYWLTDFEGYNPNARKPTNMTQEEYVLEDLSNPGKGKPSNPITVLVDIPNTEVVSKWATEQSIQADTVSLTDANGIVLNSSISGEYARVALSTLDEGSHYARIPITLNLSSYNVNTTVSFTFYIWYGNSSSYNKFQIPDGKTVTLKVKILASTVLITYSHEPLDLFPPLSIDTATSYSTGTFTSASSQYTLTTFGISGMTKPDLDYPINQYIRFQNKTDWTLQYTILNTSGNTIQSYKNVPSTISTYMSVDATGTPGRYSIAWSGSITFGAVNGDVPIQSGYTIRFRITPGPSYSPV